MGDEPITLRPERGDPDKVELYLSTPAGDGPWPAILFVHGHQIDERPGARVFADVGRLTRLVDRGFVAAAVSMPGYGKTPGPPDYCGPRTQAAIEAALDHLADHPAVDRDRIALYGVSRGAIASAMVATRHAQFKALVLVAGMYDLAESYPTGDPGLDQNIERETGATPDAFAARSALLHAEKIRAATLILHGENDVQGKSVDQARRLAAALRARGVDVREEIFPSVGHRIPIPLAV